MRYSMFAVMAILIGCSGAEPAAEAPAAEAPAASEPAEHGDHAAHAAPEPSAAATPNGPQPTRVLEDGSRLYGAELTDRETTALSQITGSPEQFAGQVVRTEGTIERVCQRMGCWMELRAENAPAVRVPMAGHAFFLPFDVAGRTATIEGRVAVQALDEGTRAHLESEGALATASSLSIDATGVIVR